MQPDSMIRMPGALLQHGPSSDRVYLMKLASPDVPRIIRFMEQLASTKGYSKLFAKVPEQAEGWFRAQGFKVEARVPGMFNGSQDGCFMAKYPKRSAPSSAVPSWCKSAEDSQGARPAKRAEPARRMEDRRDDARRRKNHGRSLQPGFRVLPFPHPRP